MKSNKSFFTSASSYKESVKRDFDRSMEEMNYYLDSSFNDPFYNAEDHRSVAISIIQRPLTFLRHLFKIIYALPVALETLFRDIKSMPDVFKGVGYIVLILGLDALKIIPSIMSLILKTIATIIFGYTCNKYIGDWFTEEDNLRFEAAINDQPYKRRDLIKRSEDGVESEYDANDHRSDSDETIDMGRKNSIFGYESDSDINYDGFYTQADDLQLETNFHDEHHEHKDDYSDNESDGDETIYISRKPAF